MHFSTVKLQKQAPDFEAAAVYPGGEIKKFTLSSLKGKYIILFFYPKDFTFVCPTEILAFNDAAEEFRKIGAEIVGISTDNEFSHFAWTQLERKKGGLGPLNIPLVSDITHKISRDYGVLFEDGPDAGVAARGLFIIDDKFNVRQITINDLPVGRSVDETKRLVEAFQFVAKHGEVCPAGWKPGSKSMKADPKGSLEFFQSQ